MTCNPSPFPLAVLAEATRIAPNRRKNSDGICAGPTEGPGDHFPDARGIPHAVDISQSVIGAPYCVLPYVDFRLPSSVFDAHAFGEIIGRRIVAGTETRVKYLVSHNYATGSAKILDPNIGSLVWRDQPGDPHTSHLHVSFNYTTAAEDSTAPFFGGVSPLPPDLTIPGDPMAVLYPLKDAPAPGRQPCAVLMPALKEVWLFNGAGLQRDQPGAGGAAHRVWTIPTAHTPLGMAPSGVRDPATNLIVPDGKGVTIVDDIGEVYEPFWS